MQQKRGVKATVEDVQQVLSLLRHSDATILVAALRLLPTLTETCCTVRRLQV